MTDRVQLRGFRTSTNNSALDSNINIQHDGSSIFEGRFRATRVTLQIFLICSLQWNGMIKRFRSAMPVSRHRRQLRFFDDCFAGREAVDFLMNELPKFVHDGREVTRVNCSKLLSLYLHMGLFCSVRGKTGNNGIFKENELYRFSSVSIDLLAATPILIRRAASFNERYNLKQAESKNKAFGLTAPQRIHLPVWASQDNDLVVSARIAFPPLQPTASLSRRLSASHGNLPFMLSSRKVIADPCGELFFKNEKRTYSGELKEIHERTQETVKVKVETAKQLNALDEVIAQLTKINIADVADPSSTQNLRHFGKVIQSQSPNSCSTSTSPGAVVNETHSGAHPFMDCREIYKNVLLCRLKSLLQVESLETILDYDFSGADVQWNCEKVGSKGIVRVPPEQDYLTNYVITMMRYLSRWPFDIPFTESTHVPYKGFELNVFKSICEQFDHNCQMLPDSVALTVLHIIRLFRQRCLKDPNSFEMRKETVFCAGISPVTRYVQRTVNAQSRNLEVKEDIMNLHATVSPDNRLLGDKQIMSTTSATRSSVSTSSAENDSFSGRMAYEAILSKLPGLQRSPELMQRIEELAKTNTLLPCSSTPSVESCALLGGIDSENEKLLKEAVSLVMLTLEPKIRRQLHYLLRFMQRVSRNYCLRMDKHRDNRTIVSHQYFGHRQKFAVSHRIIYIIR
ncbi:unnamed protein product [Thelazia callipaeda]|uniref:DEP domain-containing protein n=1 Tax=Thelazia callipaeda TaxID=103827 RepID=A0A0N5CPZ3_THECL|nr:unnamed protein product [Thelazia callipaeda]